MTIQRMDNVLIVVDDLEAAKAFFTELGMELEGEATNEGRWVDRVAESGSKIAQDRGSSVTPSSETKGEIGLAHDCSSLGCVVG
jgi:catechol 2,3-dioxygenase-like lactoylglutathione lyase family enzyme